MSSRRWILVAGLLVVASLLAPAARAQNLIVNGSFEDPLIPGDDWGIYASITGWTAVSGPGIEVDRLFGYTVYDGDQWVELDSYHPSAMEQTLTTVPGTTYILQFAYSPRPGIEDNRIQVSWNGTPLATLNGDGSNLSDTHWTLHEYTVAATSTTSAVRFADLRADDGVGGWLDAVSLVAFDPVPALSGPALAGLAFLLALAGAVALRSRLG